MKFKDGSLYEGQWRDSERSGYGTIFIGKFCPPLSMEACCFPDTLNDKKNFFVLARVEQPGSLENYFCVVLVVAEFQLSSRRRSADQAQR